MSASLTEPSPPPANADQLPDSIGEHAHDPDVAHHFQSWEQQREAHSLGMWLFIAQEVMFFGGLFTAYGAYRFLYSDAFHAASTVMYLGPGIVNTIILLLSSFSMAMAVYYAQVGKYREITLSLISTLVLGMVFLVIKWVFEYAPKIEHGLWPGANFHVDASYYPQLAAFVGGSPEALGELQIFFILYYLMTGMHALHMIIGFGILAVMIVMSLQKQFTPRGYAGVENFGLYWHFVDIVWVFLFPLFYLIH